MVIKLKRDGELYVKNIGRRDVYVNGKPIRPNEKRPLPDNALMEVRRRFAHASLMARHADHGHQPGRRGQQGADEQDQEAAGMTRTRICCKRQILAARMLRPKKA